MANVNVTYQEMEAAADRLSNGRTEIQAQLEALQRQVEGLVAGGYVTDRSSAVFLDSYTEFTTGCAATIEGLEGMGGYLRTAARTFADADEQLAGALRR